MRKLNLMPVVVLLGMLLGACNNEVVESLEEMNKTPVKVGKLCLGEKYSVHNLPVDIYDYVPKDTLDKYLPLLGDSISLTHAETVRGQKSSRIDIPDPGEIGGGYFKFIAGSYASTTPIIKLTCEVGVKIKYSLNEYGTCTFVDGECYIRGISGSVSGLLNARVDDERLLVKKTYIVMNAGGDIAVCCEYELKGAIYADMKVGDYVVNGERVCLFKSSGTASDEPSLCRITFSTIVN